jgi:predicted choloylglycine hydrolase
MLFARCAPDHTFVVVHYRDTASHRRYALFQSFETEYSLQEFLQQNDNSMDCVQFKEFLCSYFSLLQSSLWNAALETFYHKAFRVALKITYDSKNPYADQRTDIRYAAASLEDFLNRDTDFTVYKRRTRFPQILPWKDWSIG